MRQAFTLGLRAQAPRFGTHETCILIFYEVPQRSSYDHNILYGRGINVLQRGGRPRGVFLGRSQELRRFRGKPPDTKSRNPRLEPYITHGLGLLLPPSLLGRARIAGYRLGFRVYANRSWELRRP